MNIIIPLAYTEVFKKDSLHEDYFNFIGAYPKNQLLQRLAFLSSESERYLKALVVNNSISTHLEYLGIFMLPNEVLVQVIASLQAVTEVLTIAYTRDSILYAMEEVIQSDLEDGLVTPEVNIEFANNVFYYLMSINDIYFKSNQLSEDFEMADLNAAVLPANNIPDYLTIPCLVKGARLLKYLNEDPIYSSLLTEYLEKEYNCDIDHYIGFYLRWTTGNGNDIRIEEHGIEYSILKKLSQKQSHSNEIRRLTTIRVSPIYQIDVNNFVILDKELLLGKIYYQFIYEFWFGCLKNNTEISIKVYLSKIGMFFEQYTSELLKKLFSFLKHPKPLSGQELEFPTGKGKREFIDFYARKNRKVILGEIKLGNLSDKDRYSGDVEGLYSRGKDIFFYNLKQLDSAISDLALLKHHFDEKLEVDKKLTIYPICVLNDIIYRFPTMKIVFSKIWEEYRLNHKDLDIRPLVFFQIEELEELVYKLNSKGKNKMIWEILDLYCKTNKGIRNFSLSKLESYPLKCDDKIMEEFQGYMDLYK